MGHQKVTRGIRIYALPLRILYERYLYAIALQVMVSGLMSRNEETVTDYNYHLVDTIVER